MRLVLGQRAVLAAIVAGLAGAAPANGLHAQDRAGLEDLAGREAAVKESSWRTQGIANFNGVWRSRGYGWLWLVRDGKVETYDEIGERCLKSVASKVDPLDRVTAVDVSEDGKVMTALLGDDAYSYIFDRIERLPVSCSLDAASDPQSVLEAAIETIEKHYAFFAARKIEWATAVAEARSKITASTTKRELFNILSRLLSRFPDSHVNLQASLGGRELSYDPTDEPSYRHRSKEAAAAVAGSDDYWAPHAVKKLLKHGGRTAAHGDIVYGLIDGVGYLRIDAMEGYSIEAADRALLKAVELFQGTEAVVIDVSLNDGGRDAIARRIAGFFASDRTTGYSKRPGDAEQMQPYQAIPIEPAKQARYAGPVYLITGPKTLSAAEVFVLAMRALPNVTQVGEATDGSLSDELLKPLPNGWVLSLSNEVYLDCNGVSWEGLGIPPQIPLRIKYHAYASKRDLAAARRLIESRFALRQ